MIASAEQAISSVRFLAADILTRVETRKAYADILLDHALKTHPLDLRDRALLTQIVYGTLRWRGKIDAELKRQLRRPLKNTDPRIRNLLRLTGYQLLFLDRVPDYAAVNEAVELAKLHGGGRAGGFVNGVLRNLLRTKSSNTVERRQDHSIRFIAAEYSHPEWLVRNWIEEFGPESTLALMRANNEEAPLALRANSLKCSRKELLGLFLQAGIQAKPTPSSPHGILVPYQGAVENFPGFAEGLFQVQAESSQLIAFLLGALPGERILDACAAPGGKATHIAETMKNCGELIAIDKAPAGIAKLRASIARLGIQCLQSYEADAARTLDHPLSGPYDRILVDAPCSGLGTLRSHPEIKWYRQESDIHRLSLLQSKILDNVARYLKPGGVLVYATCTLTSEENARIVESFVMRQPKFELEDAARYLPSNGKTMVRGNYFEALPYRDDTDGFFAARLKRTA